MSRIEHILKSRQEYTCGKCGCVIEKGSGYFRANRMYQKPVIRCEDCGIKPYETGNEYTQEVGAIAEDWRSSYDIEEETVEYIINALDDIKCMEEEKLENLGENLRYSPNGEMFQERIDNIDSVISDLEDIDFEQMRDTEAENFASDKEGLDISISTYEELTSAIQDDEKLQREFVEYYNNAIAEAIDNALGNLEY